MSSKAAFLKSLISLITKSLSIFSLEMIFPLRRREAVIGLVTDLFHSGVVGNKMMLMSQSGKGIILHNIHDGKEDKVLDLERFYDLKTAGEFINGRGKVLTRRIKPKELAKAFIGIICCPDQTKSYL